MPSSILNLRFLLGRMPFYGILIVFLTTALTVNPYLVWSRLRHIPGPRLAPFSNLWKLKSALSGRMPEALNDVCETYGSLARIGPNDLICSDPDVIRRMGTAKLGYRRSRFYSSFAFNPDQDTMLSTIDEKIHADLKVKTAAGYSGKDVEKPEQSIDRQLNAFIDLIERQYLSTPTNFRPFDFAKKIQYFTLDAITDVAFGTPFGCVAQDDDMYDYIKTVEQLLPAAVVAGVLPWLVAKDIIAKRFGESKEVQNDMLGSFIAHGLTQEEANSETLLQVIAGTDTTATAIRAMLLHITTSPTCYMALQAAIDEGVKNGEISSPVTDAEARAIPYLQAVIKEGLRKFPVIAGLLPKTVHEGGDIINGFSIPAGTDVSLSLISIAHSKATFGPDAHIFRPERWLECDDNDKSRKMTLAADLVFGSGKWSCSGKNIAMMEMGKILVELFRRFDISLVNPIKPWKSFSAGAYIQSDLLVRFAKRTH
ncbi:uncharacterized protein EAE98_004332 [Botrytis deweyae]|uniref:Ig-like domain-containing protein n=1 Tax=Botrytis deweyae TaxID=2478750 RepID=A0ABQ7IQR4_9HELO|nr:uncharacterized protein EAE98_004332 [Botrytis deweyae]KAF7931596.1 hypothetical protein EAE98_004332 [Botrytis deweyae]